MKAILRSPFHGMVSKNIMLLTFTGQKSGRVHSTPVNYVQDHNEITVFSFRQRTWWRNLRGGAPVTVRIRGQNLKAVAECIEDEKTVASGLLAYLQQRPNYAKYFQVALNQDGQPKREEVVQAAKNRVMIKVQLI